MEGDGMKRTDGGGRKCGWGTSQSSKTAPHFGHFVSVSLTSAPQFVQVKAAAFEAFPPGSVAGQASREPSFGPTLRAGDAAPFARSCRARRMYHQRNRIAKYPTTEMSVTWDSTLQM